MLSQRCHLVVLIRNLLLGKFSTIWGNTKSTIKGIDYNIYMFLPFLIVMLTTGAAAQQTACAPGYYRVTGLSPCTPAEAGYYIKESMSLTDVKFTGPFGGLPTGSPSVVELLYNTPSGSEPWAGFANQDVSIYPLSFGGGGGITFTGATTGIDAEVYFRFEFNPYPNVDPSFETLHVVVSGTVEAEYSVAIPTQGGNTYSSFLLYVVTRDAPVSLTNVIVNSAIQQVACAEGYYQANTGQSSCTPAEAGYYVESTAQISQTACAAGTYQAITGQSSCTPAEAGYYVNSTAQISQTECAEGTYIFDLNTSAAGANTGQTSCFFPCSFSDGLQGCSADELIKIKQFYNIHPDRTCGNYN